MVTVYIISMFIFAVLSCSSGGIAEGEISINGKIINVEIALNNAERAKGLMKRKSLDPDSGMLFVFPYDRRLSFWMKNTSIPLSIAYISSDGVIKEIRDMKPFSLSPVNSKYSVKFALEVEQGYFDEIGVKPGDRISYSEATRQVLEKAED
jgi:uncharacterized membrane protein (UPF0127 family)